ncbi:MAG: N-acetyltransferase [Luteitalea sp.]|nr:N-acetyltransferase [Luteitalea sp.]
MAGSLTQPLDRVQPGIALLPVTTRARMRAFVDLPYRLHREEAHWIPPLRRDERRRLSPAHNPFWNHARADLWLARAGGRVTGRIAAIEDRLYNERQGESITWFGFFEAEDRATAAALLTAVEQRAREWNSRVVRGPVNPSLHDSAGLLVDGFDTDPYILMPYNPPTYPSFVEEAGYRKVKDLLAWAMDLSKPAPERVTRLASRVVRRNGLKVRTVDLGAFDRDLAILHQIYRAAWDDNWGFVPPTDAEIQRLAADLRPILDPELVLFVELAGRPVACSVALPDMNQVLKLMNGRLLPFAIVHFLRRRRIIDQTRLLMLGVLPDVRRLGLYPLLMAESHRRAIERGYRRGESSWTLEDNAAVNAGIEALGGRRSKTYRLYEKPVG